MVNKNELRRSEENAVLLEYFAIGEPNEPNAITFQLFCLSARTMVDGWQPWKKNYLRSIFSKVVSTVQIFTALAWLVRKHHTPTTI